MMVAGSCFGWMAVVPVWAATTTTFTVSATVPDPPATVIITVDSISTSNGAFTAEPSGFTALSFDPMAFNTTNNIYLPDHYFAVNFAVSSGPGQPDVNFSYTEGTNPNGSSNGLGTKSSIAFADETTSGETVLTGPYSKTTLSNLEGSGVHVPYTALATNSYLRAYVGVCTGGSSDPSGCHPFTNADAAGQYTGTLTTTATVD